MMTKSFGHVRFDLTQQRVFENVEVNTQPSQNKMVIISHCSSVIKRMPGFTEISLQGSNNS